jgi:hypothetical protein
MGPRSGLGFWHSRIDTWNDNNNERESSEAWPKASNGRNNRFVSPPSHPLPEILRRHQVDLPIYTERLYSIGRFPSCIIQGARSERREGNVLNRDYDVLEYEEIWSSI